MLIGLVIGARIYAICIVIKINDYDNDRLN